MLVAVLVLAGAVAPARAAQRYGDVQFPQDEHMHQDGFDYWWGAADVTTTAGNRYTNNKGGCRMIIILRRPCLSNILLAFDPA